MKFVCYRHSLILGDNHLVTKQFIALKHEDGRLQFTNFHRYVKSAARIKRFCCKVFQKIYFSVKLRKKTERTE